MLMRSFPISSPPPAAFFTAGLRAPRGFCAAVRGAALGLAGATAILSGNLGNGTCADGVAAFTDGKAELLLKRYRGNELYFEGDRVARHDHFGAIGESDLSGHIGGTDVELRLVAVEERGVAAALILVKDVNLRLKVGGRRD